jgi:hypothetical protein
MEFVDKNGPMGCWLWLGGKNESGYGSLNWKGKQSQRAHRISYQIHVGPLLADDVLRHSCDNPPCVNPAHLQPGTHADNMHDKIRRGRAWNGPLPRGERSHQAKLTEDSVRQIRMLSAAGVSRIDLANTYGVSRATIRNVLNGKTWAWLDTEAMKDPEFQKSADPALRKRPAGTPVKTREVGTCSISDCDETHYGRGWCAKHYARWQNHGDPLAFIRAFEDRTKNRKCEVDGCETQHHSKGYCIKHLRRFDTHGDPAKVISPNARRPRLIEKTVCKIRASDEGAADIAARFGILESLVDDIRAGRSYTRWSHLSATKAA